MLKRDELSNPLSCLNRALDDEMLFVLLARDPAAPAVIRTWIGERLRLRRNTTCDPQLLEAEDAARRMEVMRPRIRVIVASQAHNVELL